MGITRLRIGAPHSAWRDVGWRIVSGRGLQWMVSTWSWSWFCLGCHGDLFTCVKGLQGS